MTDVIEISNYINKNHSPIGCPHCGVDGIMIYSDMGFRVKCPKCGSSGPGKHLCGYTSTNNYYWKLAVKALNGWNRRVHNV